jgi:hypothetical protein
MYWYLTRSYTVILLVQDNISNTLKQRKSFYSPLRFTIRYCKCLQKCKYLNHNIHIIKRDYFSIDLHQYSVIVFLASPVRHSTFLVNDSVFKQKTSACISKDLYFLIRTQYVFFKVKFYIMLIRNFYFKE